MKWTLDFEMDSQEIFGDFGRKDSRLRCFVVKLIWPSWNCGQVDGVYVEVGYAWIPSESPFQNRESISPI